MMFIGILTVFLRVVLSYGQRLVPLAVLMCFHVWPIQQRTAVNAGHSERMKKHVLAPLR